MLLFLTTAKTKPVQISRKCSEHRTHRKQPISEGDFVHSRYSKQYVYAYTTMKFQGIYA